MGIEELSPQERAQAVADLLDESIRRAQACGIDEPSATEGLLGCCIRRMTAKLGPFQTSRVLLASARRILDQVEKSVNGRLN